MRYLRLFWVALPLAFFLDLAWVGGIASPFYHQQLAPLFSLGLSWPPALLFYVVYVAALVFFVIEPAVRRHRARKAIFEGAFFGLAAFATYDLTNQATIVNWPLVMTVVDMAWGASSAAFVSWFTFLIATRVLGR